MASWILRQYRTIAFDGQGCVAQEMPCAECGYDLRGKTARERCPECETGVWKAIRAARSPRRWHPLWDVLIVAALVLLLIVLVAAYGDFDSGASYCRPWSSGFMVYPANPVPPPLMTKPIDQLVWPWAIVAAFAAVWIIRRRARKSPRQSEG